MHELINIQTNEPILLASDIDELSPDQYLQYLELLHRAEQSAMSVSEMRLHILQIVIQIKFGTRYMAMLKEKKTNLWFRIYQLSEMLDSFFDIENIDGRKHYKAHTQSAHNLLPEYQGRKGPDDMLNDLSWGDFVACMGLLNANKQVFVDNDSLAIDAFLSQLFDILYTYADDRDNNNNTIPTYVKMHAFTYFSYVFQLLSTTPIPIYGEEIDFSILFSGGSTKADDKTGWIGLGFTIAQSGVFGVTKEMNNEKLWTVLIYLYKCAFDNIHTKSTTK